MRNGTDFPAATKLFLAVKPALPRKTKLDTRFETLNSFSRPARINQHVRKAIEQGQLGQIIECIKQPQRSTISIASPGVLKHSLRGLRSYPQKAKWSEVAVTKALARSRTIATLLEAGERKDPKSISPNSKSPEVLGVYLELAAVNAYKHQAGSDVDGKVKAAAGRLLTGFEHNPAWLEKSWTAPEAGQVDVVLDTVPIWHGLTLAQKMLGGALPQKDLAQQIIAKYGNGLKSVTEEVRAKQPKKGTYGHEALTVWDGCIKE